MNVTLRQLRAFVAVAQEQSFTRAAARLHVTQSTLTASIQALESEIGMRLFDRSTRSVLATPQGQQFLPAAERMLRELQEALEEMRQTADRRRGSVAGEGRDAAAPADVSSRPSPAPAPRHRRPPAAAAPRA